MRLFNGSRSCIYDAYFTCYSLDEFGYWIFIFCAGLQGIDHSFEAGYIDGVRNRWQELWYITLPSMKPMLFFGAVMAITQSFNVADVTMQLAGFPSTDYTARTVVSHLIDYGSMRFELGYASSISIVLTLTILFSIYFIKRLLNRVGK